VDGFNVRVQAELGTAEVVGRDGRTTLLVAGQRKDDVCVPPPGKKIDPPEESPPDSGFWPVHMQ
jgi:hypothetical protein